MDPQDTEFVGAETQDQDEGVVFESSPLPSPLSPASARPDAGAASASKGIEPREGTRDHTDGEQREKDGGQIMIEALQTHSGVHNSHLLSPALVEDIQVKKIIEIDTSEPIIYNFLGGVANVIYGSSAFLTKSPSLILQWIIKGMLTRSRYNFYKSAPRHKAVVASRKIPGEMGVDLKVAIMMARIASSMYGYHFARHANEGWIRKGNFLRYVLATLQDSKLALFQRHFPGEGTKDDFSSTSNKAQCPASVFDGARPVKARNYEKYIEAQKTRKTEDIYEMMDLVCGIKPEQIVYLHIGSVYTDVVWAVIRVPKEQIGTDSMSKGAVVLAIRGSSTLFDWCADFHCRSIEAKGESFPSGSRLHEGFAFITVSIIQEAIKYMKPFVAEGYDPYVTGHSLGGGVTAVATQALRSVFPNIRGVCFAPPPCMDYQLALSCQDYITSFIYRADVVPRAGIFCLVQALQADLGDYHPDEPEPDTSTPEGMKEYVNRIRTRTVPRSMPKTHWNALHTPGKLFFISEDPDSMRSSTSIPSPRNIDLRKFTITHDHDREFVSQIFLDRHMIEDHFPHNYVFSLLSLAKKNGVVVPYCPGGFVEQ